MPRENELKRSWEETDLPDDVYARVRDQAWSRYREGGRWRRRSRVWAVAAVLLLSLATAVLVRMDQGRHPERLLPGELVRLAPETGVSPSLSEWRPVEPPPAQRVFEAKLPEEDAAGGPAVEEADLASPTDSAPVAEAGRRKPLVVRFQLPKTGAEMIWILEDSESEDIGE